MRTITKLTQLVIYLAFMAPITTAGQNLTAVSRDGTKIAYSVSGKGEPTLVFIHGWSCNQSVWKKQVPYFEKNYRVVTMDLAGHGASGQERAVYTMEAFGEDAAAVVRAVGTKQAIVMGHSMGGAVIVEAAEMMPEEIAAIVGIDTLHDFEEVLTAEQKEEFLKPFKEDFKKHTDSFVRGMFVEGTDPNLMDEVAGMMSGASPRVGISALDEMFKRSYVTNPPKIKMPVWCLNADLWPTKLEVNRKFVPEFNLRIMPGVGHFLMLEKPEEFNKQLDQIIQEITKR
jgi:pimeloyl-ACP methyl ester carboxylesterase